MSEKTTVSDGEQSFDGADRYKELSQLHGYELAEATGSAKAEDPNTGESVILPSNELTSHLEERKRESLGEEYRERQTAELREQVSQQQERVNREQERLDDLQRRLTELQQ